MEKGGKMGKIFEKCRCSWYDYCHENWRIKKSFPLSVHKRKPAAHGRTG
jgi:hypothetical protein